MSDADLTGDPLALFREWIDGPEMAIATAERVARDDRSEWHVHVMDERFSELDATERVENELTV